MVGLLGSFVFAKIYDPSALTATSAPSYLYLSLVVGFIAGALVVHSWISKGFHTRMVLMPDGFIRFSFKQGFPYTMQKLIISYKDVEDLQFDRITNILTIPMPPAHHEIPLGDFDEAPPHLIAQRIERTYTRFRAHNTIP